MSQNPSVTDIIRSAGGAAVIAAATDQTEWAIAKWSRNGIPEKHWAALRRLNRDLSAELLHGVNETIRAARNVGPSVEAA